MSSSSNYDVLRPGKHTGYYLHAALVQGMFTLSFSICADATFGNTNRV